MKMIIRRFFAALLCVLLLLGALSGCKGDDDYNGAESLVIGCDYPEAAIGAFWGERNQLDLLVFDRLIACDESGEFILSGADNAIADCMVEVTDSAAKFTFLIREDICFADGKKLDADDVIFSMYVLADPSYDGDSVFCHLPILGMSEYRDGMKKWQMIYADIISVMESSEPKNEAMYTEAEFELFVEAMNSAGERFIAEIIDYCVNTFSSTAADYFNCDAVDFSYNKGLATAMAMYCWGVGELREDEGFVTASGEIFNLEESYPEVEDFWHELSTSDPSRYAVAQVTYDEILAEFIQSNYPQLDKFSVGSGSVGNISGIEKTGELSLTVTMSQFDSLTLDALSINVAPLHYYADESQFDIDAGLFGFEKGCLDTIKENDRKPMGTGAYAFSSAQSSVIFLEASEYYRAGKANIDNVIIKQVDTENALYAVTSGEVDIMEVAPDPDDYQRIVSRSLSNGSVFAYEYPGTSYGYIGINAERVCMEDDSSSYESKMLRRGIAILFSAYKEQTMAAYFSGSAQVIEYPMAAGSWAYTDSADIAYEYNTDGRKIYTDNMTYRQREDAALKAAEGCFTASGVKKECYTFAFCAEDDDHPTYELAVAVSEILSDYGIVLVIKRVSDEDIFFEKLAEGEYDLWAASWESGAEPDLFSSYHSRSIGSLNYYCISDGRLDDLIAQARSTADYRARYDIYAECCEVIFDWAVEVPLYTKSRLTVVSNDRVDISTLIDAPSAYLPWTAFSSSIEMYPETKN